jgi:hypothetical protein
MSRVIVIVASGLALAGCASGGSGDFWPKYEPAPVSVQFQSEPAGAEAKTSNGSVCQTPCTLAMAPDKGFSVTFSLPGYDPQTVPVQVAQPDGAEVLEAGLQPNPVAVELSKSTGKKPPAKRRAATTASAAKPAAAKPATRPAAAPRQSAPPPAATDVWPPPQ